MRYFLDTEFIEDGKTIDLISIGIVAEDGREFYALNWDCDLSKASDWVKENVISQLPDRHRWNLAVDSTDLFGKYSSRARIKTEILDFCLPLKYGKPEFWGWYSATDWVAFYQLFGRLVDKPKDFPHICYDIKQWCDQLGNPRLPEKPTQGKHTAIVDARWNKQAWEFIRTYSEDCAVERT